MSVNLRSLTVRPLSHLGALLVVGALLAGMTTASPASAASPWWHLATGARPTYLHSGVARDEVQELKVSATGGFYTLAENRYFISSETYRTRLPYNASAQEVQEHLESEVYPGSSLSVREGSSTPGSRSYIITFPGQPVEPIAAFSSELTGGAAEATVTEISRGRPDGEVVVMGENLGDANVNSSGTPLGIVDRLPAGLRAVAIDANRSHPEGDPHQFPQFPCAIKTLTCTMSEPVPLAPYDHVEVRVLVEVEPLAASGGLNEVSFSGGGAPGASIERPITVSSTPTPFGVESYSLTLEEEGGAPDTQAGSHPFQLTTAIMLNQVADKSPLNGKPDVNPAQVVKDLNFKIPPGLIGNPTPIPQCSIGKFFNGVGGEANECSPDTAIGVATVDVNEPNVLGYLVFTVPLFNVEPRVGEPARFGFYLPLAGLGVLIDTSVRTGGDYGVTATVENITQTAAFVGSTVTFWGVPGDPRHDNARGWGCLAVSHNNPEAHCNPAEIHNPPPFLALPTSCTGQLQSTVEADPWAQEGVFASLASDPMQSLDGCNRLPFSPTISVAPDGEAGSTPSGLTVGIHVPQAVSLDSEGLSEADVKDTTVALPTGVALNPAAADGLQACTDVAEPGRPEGEIGLGNAQQPSCPEASKVGTVEIKSPLLPNPLTGAAYLAAQNANPFGSLVALYVVAEDPVSGSLIKLAGEVVPDQVTGQLISTFKNTPQLPFEDFKLHFFGGSRAPLSTPAMCGSYTTTTAIAPWSGNPPSTPSSTFNVTSGPGGSPCAAPLPFDPTLTAGTTSIQAGGFSPFVTTFSRDDGDQNLRSIQLHMPPGLLGTLSSVKLCGEAQANAGTCGPESLIGHTTVSVGLGGDPFSVTGGQVFITGPYKGAPFGLSIVNPAKAGPFDLGQVIVRAKIEVDKTTSALTITTDDSGPYKIPTILDGIPLQIKHVNVNIDRPGFTFNPTNCNPLAITGTLNSDQGTSKALSVPLQVTNCAVLAFKPKLTAKTSGKTSRKNGASLSVKLTYPAGPYDANISRVKVDLPKQLPSRLTTLQKACTAAQFDSNPAGCPAASLIGHAKAVTPVIPVPLEGPAYFVSHGGEAFPSLIIVLQGYGVTVDLVGSTFINSKGITSSTFKTVPDVPVGTFELTLPQGKFSALAANGNLCKSKLAMPTAFVGQNGAQIHTSTPITTTGCPKAKKAKKAKQRKAGKARQGGTGRRV